MNRKFFQCSAGKPGEEYDEENLHRIIDNVAFFIHENAKQKGVWKQVRPRDVLLLKYKNHYVAYGEAVTRQTIKGNDGWNLKIQVKEWLFFDIENYTEGIHKYGIKDNTLKGAGVHATVKGITTNFAFEKISEINDQSELYFQLKKEFEEHKSLQKMENIIQLLKQKHQIILQGAPGTGKTYTAKEIAKQMTKPVKLGSPVQIINDFFKTYKPVEESLKIRDEQHRLIETFQKEFPLEKLKDIELEEYVLGFGSKNSFSWWIEYGLEHMGKYTGPATKFKIYWSKSKNEFSKSGFVKNLDDDEAVKMIGEQLYSIANNVNLEKAIKSLSNGLVLKILHSYYPKKYFPVNSVKYIDNALKILKIDAGTKNPVEKNLALQQYFEQKKKQHNSDITSNEFMMFLVDNFNLKGDVETEESDLVLKGEYKVIQFHPAYTYEDFVRGISVETDDNNNIQYKVKNRVLAKFAQKALDSPKANFVLIIDEINRANLPAVLGELIYALEYRYDKDNPDETSVESMYALYDEDDEDNPESKLITLPKNLFIIGTMNTADRSVGHIDYAIRRRFAFVDINPDKSIIETEKGRKLFDEMTGLFCKEYSNSGILEHSDHLSREFNPLDVMIGHSYFMGVEENLKMRLEYEIKPILNEYLKDGVLLESAKEIIENLSVSDD